MLNRRRLLTITAATACLLVVSAASADPINTFTGAATPSHVKPSTSAAYSVSLTNDTLSPEGADRAKIAIPPGFAVDAPSVLATTNAVGACQASTWIADGDLIADAKINLKRPGISSGDELCAGATLTVVFTATSGAVEGTSVWTSELLRGVAPFALLGSQPTVQVDGSAPQVGISSSPSNPSNDDSPTFSFTTSEPATLECRLDQAAFAACASPKSYNALAQGSHTFVVRATDPAGNAGQASQSWTIDTAAPTTSITSKPTDPSNDSSPSFGFTMSEPAAAECNLDGAGFAPCSSPRSYTGVADGPHTFAIRAKDAAGNVGAAATYGWTIDTVAPSATITGKPNDPSNDSSPSFAFTAGEPAQFQCKLDAAAFASCGSPKDYTSLGNGLHTFVVKATDAAGNVGPEASHGWTVDTVAPVTTITQKPGNPSNDSSPSFAFTADEAAQFQCKLDAAAFESCASPRTYNGLTAGPHTFSVRATDAAGNPGLTTAYTWTIDTMAPTAELRAKPANPSNETSPRFTFVADDATAQFTCKLDAAPFEPCTSPKVYAAVAPGSHTFSVRATDAAANTGAAETYSWTIDTTAPTTAITQKPSDPSNDSSPSFAFMASEAGSQFACRLDGSSFATCVSAKSYSSLAEGSHTFAVRANDAAGNVGVETTYTWVVDTVAPTVTITGKPTDPSNVSSPSFTFAASQPGSSFVCKLDGAAFAPCTSPATYPGLANGSHTFVVKATDPAGNPSADATHTWTIDTVAPTTAITGKPSDPSNNSSPTFSFTASESGSTFLCRLDAAPFTSCASPTQHPNVPQGAHTFVVKGTDKAGNTGPEATYTWTIDTAAPTAEITQKPPALSSSNSASFSFTATQAGSTFTCRLDAEAFAACSSPRPYTGIGDGPHTFAVKATDPAGNTSAETSYTWTVDTTAPATQLMTKPNDPSNDITPRFAFSAGEAGSTFACKLDTGAFASCVSPTTLATLAPGPHTFSVRATDPAGNTGPQVNHAWTIDTVAPATTITQKPTDPSNTRAPSFAFTGSEPGTFSCRLDGAPFAPCPTPTSYSGLGDGSHTFAVRATDLAGNTGAPSSHTWTIDATPPTVTLNQKPTNPSNDSSPSFSFTSSEGGSSLACKLDNAAFETCVSPKTYSAVASGSHTFSVRATDAAANTGVVETYTWTIDTTAPTATITQKPANPSNTKSPTFAFSSNEAGVVYACRLELGGFEPCPPLKSYADLTDGQHAFAVRATDPAGNTGVAATYTWTIDTVAPTVAITGKPGNPSNNPSPSFGFAATEDSSFICSLDGSEGACASPAVFSSLSDGVHTFGVRATDAAGNTGPQTSHSWTIETRSPTATLTSGPPGLTNTSAASFAFAADEPSSFDCNVDGRGFEPCSSPATYHGFGDGGHAFTVRARDTVGNFSSHVSHSWTIDTTAPQTTVVSAPKTGTASSATFAFSASEGGTFECRLDGAAFALCSSPKSYSGLSKATHQFEVRAVDAAGNADATPAVHAWKIETAVIKAAQSTLMAPRAGARVTRPPLLVWRRATRARYYNVQVYRGRRKILTTWPTKTRFQLQMRWKNLGRKEQLLPGSYRWYVWPGYGAPSARRYGQLLGQSSFVVARRSGR